MRDAPNVRIRRSNPPDQIPQKVLFHGDSRAVVMEVETR
jgi:hypothetical protein